MAKLQLNEKQKLWFKQFKAEHPNATIKSQFKLNGNYRLEICWFDSLPPILIGNCIDQGWGWIYYQAWFTVNKNCKFSFNPKYTKIKITYPHCNITRNIKRKLKGQLTLNLGSVLLNFKPKLISKVHKNRKRRYPKSKKHQVYKQLSLSIKI
ncbi:MAG: hypothetical protein AAFW70_01060 [Cyanobacteria bacterium J06635_10]